MKTTASLNDEPPLRYARILGCRVLVGPICCEGVLARR